MQTLQEAKTTLEFGLERVKAGWCQGAYARACNGNIIGPLSPGAVTFCALGAANLDCGLHPLSKRTLAEALPAEFLARPSRKLAIERIDDYNDLDGTTQADIVALYERALLILAKRIQGELQCSTPR